MIHLRATVVDRLYDEIDFDRFMVFELQDDTVVAPGLEDSLAVCRHFDVGYLLHPHEPVPHRVGMNFHPGRQILGGASSYQPSSFIPPVPDNHVSGAVAVSRGAGSDPGVVYRRIALAPRGSVLPVSPRIRSSKAAT